MKDDLPQRISGSTLPPYFEVLSEAIEAAARTQLGVELPGQWSTDPATLQRVVKELQQLPGDQ